jgi:rhodanese-related sulfurtransferase
MADTTSPSAIDILLAAARADLIRVQPADLAAELSAGALVVDIRPLEQRRDDGDLPGAVVIDRNVLEWRLDPSSPHHIPEASDAARRVIVVCNEGFSSSLAAATLRQLGLRDATDLVGGFQLWRRTVPRPRKAPPSRTDLIPKPSSATAASSGARELHEPSTSSKRSDDHGRR